MKAPELLAPAGSVEALDAAVGEGADAVYLGLKNFNARLRSANFAWSQYEAALRSLRRMGRRLYVTVNTVFEEREADRMYQFLQYLSRTGPDAIIVQDFGVLKMAKDCFPSLKIHASTQMNIASAQGVNMLSRQGVSRVVLARELSLEEIRDLRSRTGSELEVFVHGALCVSASGLCLFSSYLGGKSANRGLCTQACRRYYRQEGGEGGYYFSPSDLELVANIPVLAGMGINSFKIEGRMKSAEYVGAVVAAYRRVLDADEGRREESILEARRILRYDFARKKTEFYFFRDRDGPRSAPPDWLNPGQSGGVGIFLGTLLQVRGGGPGRRGLLPPAEGEAAPRLEPGDSLRLHRADDSERGVHKVVSAEYGAEGCWVSVPEGYHPGDSVYLIQRRQAGGRYPRVIREGARASRGPGRDSAPEPQFPAAPGEKPGSARDLSRTLPQGIYVAVSRVEDLFTIQSVRPLRVILSLNQETAGALLEPGGPPLPFPRKEIILSLDPWFPQGDAALLEDWLDRLLGQGYTGYVLNNPGHFSLLRGKPDAGLLVAGPWLYTFNRWSAAFVSSLGAAALISPLENNRQNLERTAAPARRAQTLVTIFSWPVLFRIRADLSSGGLDGFAGNRDESFRLTGGDFGSRVVPETPFSIVDKRPFLEQAGFRRFVIDLSAAPEPIKKKDYRNIMAAAEAGRPLPGLSRFNWKNGFHSTENAKAPAKP